VSLADRLESAADALPELAEAIRPANGDPERLLEALAPEAALRLLVWLLEHAPESGGELALAWADSERGAEPLTRAEAAAPEGLGKAGRKALRRALHRLRSRGVAVAPAAPEPRVASLPRLADELGGALVSAPDPGGAQLVVLVEPSPAGGARVFQAAVDLERGILEFHVLSASRSQARRLVRDLESNTRLGAVAVEREAASALLARAAEAHPPDRALPHAFAEWRAHVARPSDPAALPGALARAALDAPLEIGLVREVAERVAAGALGPWPPALELLRELAERVQKTAASPLLVNEAQRRAQVEQVVGDALEARYAAPAAEHTALRLEEAAHVAWRRGHLDEARALLAGARAFRERPPRDNPLARALLERALGPMLEALRTEQASSLLVKP
jgi:hypothetical protein